MRTLPALTQKNVAASPFYFKINSFCIIGNSTRCAAACW